MYGIWNETTGWLTKEAAGQATWPTTGGGHFGFDSHAAQWGTRREAKRALEEVDRRFEGHDLEVREIPRGRGRPLGSTIDNPRDVTRRQRWTAGEWEQIEAAAERDGVTPSEFVRRAALDAAAAGA